MVCLGNICRSPLAEGILRDMAHENSLHDWQIESAGTGAYYHLGAIPDYNSIEIAKQHGIDISTQKARQLQVADLDNYDIIYALDKHNLKDIHQLCQHEAHTAKVHLLMNEVYPSQNISVPDPYGKGVEAFAQVFDMLTLACDAIIKKHKPA